MSHDTRKERTKKALEEALVSLLEHQNFNDISTSDLAKTANISRSNFYNHYKDKYEMIDIYQKTVFHKLEAIFDKNQFDKSRAFLEIFEFLDRESLFAALLTQNGTIEIQTFIRNKLQRMISQDLFDVYHDKEDIPAEKLYSSVYFSHAIFGVYQMWVTRGKQETPQEITQLLLTLLS
ncbi:TetR/AcrR family transcriptional regulator [Streptococcus sp. zg-JUN1979]|uniref:TetR/AcrR family transcriptional regulator n=1 Tax=Streptococcus sp. zg-JUN1979 TaxID=3391450 RepID=UPI0039A45E5F